MNGSVPEGLDLILLQLKREMKESIHKLIVSERKGRSFERESTVCMKHSVLTKNVRKPQQ